MEQALVEFNPGFEKRSGSLYGVVYYFYRKETGIDADNISKPIWDCLRGITYDDDSQVAFRVAAKTLVRDSSLTVREELPDLQGLPKNVLSAFNEFVEQVEIRHFVYVELGQWAKQLVKFNWEGHAD